jgi:WD40 repeat protein/tetratricopeptide (TPR) repeat protein
MSADQTDTLASGFPTVLGYEIHGEQRRDRLGVVYRARQVLHSREVALRLVDEHIAGHDLTHACKFARHAALAVHPHLLSVLEVGEYDGQFYLATELATGPPLRQRLAAGVLPPAEAASLVAAVARAVHQLHEHHVLHLAVSSAGIFLASDGSPRVGDVGLSELLHDHPASPFPGDRSCAAPEQLAMKKADPRTDVYALGCLLQECLMGSPSDPVAGRPPALEQVCRKALATRPERRYLSAADMANDLESFSRGDVPGPKMLHRFTAWARIWAAALFAALLIVLVGSIGLFVILTGRQATLRSEVERWRRQAESAAQESREARDERDRAARRDSDKIRAAGDRLRQTSHQRDLERQRATDEELLRKQAQKQSIDIGSQRAQAEERARDADAARVAAVALRTETVRQLARLYVSQGTALMDSGDLTGALVPFVRALSSAHGEKLPEDAHRLRIAAMLSRCPRPMNIQCYKRDDVNRVQLSRDGQRILIAGSDGVVTVRIARTGKLLGKRLLHGAAVAGAVFSPDGRRALTADAMGQLRMWNAEDGSAVFDPVTLVGVPSNLGFSGDGKRFFVILPRVMSETPAEAQVYDAASGETVGEAIAVPVLLRPTFVSPFSPNFLSPNGKRLLLCGTDRTVRMYDVATGKQAGPALEHPHEVLFANFSADGRLLVTAAIDGTARVWDSEKGKTILPALDHGSLFVSPQLDETGRLVLTATRDGTVRVHDTTTGKPVGLPLRIRSALRQAALSPDGRYAFLAGADGVVSIYPITQSSPRFGPPSLYHGGPLRHLAISPDGSRALTFDGRTVRVWDLTAGEPPAPAGPPSEAGAVWSPDATRLARIQGDTVQLHDATGKPVGEAMKHKGEVKKVSFSPNGDLLLTTSNPPDGAATPTWDVRVWDAKTGKPVSEVMEHLREVTQASFAGKRVQTVALDKRVRLWEANTGKQIGKPRDHAEDVVLAAVSPDGTRVVTSDKEGMTRAWDAATGDRVGEGMGHARAVRFLAFSADSKTLATCCEDGTVRAWALESGRQLMEAAHSDAATHASFSPDGKYLLTAGADGMARLWVIATGKPATPPLPHGEAVHLTAFSADGRWILTAAGPYVQLWDAENGEPLGPPLPHSQGGGNVTAMALSRGGELTTQSGLGTRWTRKLVADARPDSDLAELARVVSGRDEAGVGRLAPVSVRDLESAYDHLAARYPAEFDPPRDRLRAWAQRGAAECEARELWAGVLHHLDVLLAESADASLHARRGKARSQLGRYAGALADYSAALKANPRRWEWLAGRADAAAALGRWDQVVADCTKATQIEERRGELWQRLGRAEAQRGQWKKAAEALAKAIRFGVDDPTAWYDHALAQLSAGDEKGYRRTCARLLRKFGDREDRDSRRLVADACVLGPDALADFKSLRTHAEKAVLETPADVAVRARLGALLLRAGQPARAIAALELCAAADSPRPGDLWLLVLACQKAGEKEKVKSALEKATKRKERTGTIWQERQAATLWRREAEAAAKGE